jgi:hypothetical protein
LPFSRGPTPLELTAEIPSGAAHNTPLWITCSPALLALLDLGYAGFAAYVLEGRHSQKFPRFSAYSQSELL